MENVILGALVGAVCTLALVSLVVLLRRRSRGDLDAQLEAAHREADDLRLRLDIAQARLEGHTGARRQESSKSPTVSVEYLITEIGAGPVLLERDPASVDQVQVPDRLVLSATLGAPLVRIAAFGHGVRRALSAENRNRIRFQMRQEVRAARKRRHQAFKQYQRDVRAAERASEAV